MAWIVAAIGANEDRLPTGAVEEFRAIHERITSDPSRPITPEERAALSKRIGGSRIVE